MISRKPIRPQEPRGIRLGETGAVRKKKPAVLPERDVNKPFAVRADGSGYVTLAELQATPELSGKLVDFASLSYEKQADFTIARLEHAPKDFRIGIIGGGYMSRDEIIKEIREGSEFGRGFVRSEQLWIERVREKVSKGEYLVRGQVSESLR